MVDLLLDFSISDNFLLRPSDPQYLDHPAIPPYAAFPLLGPSCSPGRGLNAISSPLIPQLPNHAVTSHGLEERVDPDKTVLSRGKKGTGGLGLLRVTRRVMVGLVL